MKKCRSIIIASLRARSISKTYQPAFFHLGECATYQPAIDKSDWPIQTVIVQCDFTLGQIVPVQGHDKGEGGVPPPTQSTKQKKKKKTLRK